MPENGVMPINVMPINVMPNGAMPDSVMPNSVLLDVALDEDGGALETPSWKDDVHRAIPLGCHPVDWGHYSTS